MLWSRYHGFEIKAEKRFANGGAILGGFTAGRNRGNIRSSSVDLNNPNNLITAIGAYGHDATYQVNVAGSWMFPWGIQWSGSLRTATGLPLQRIYQVTRTIVPTLTQVTQNVDLLSAGEVRLQNNNLLDTGVSKVFRIKGVRVQGILDVCNVLNSNATTSEVQTIGASLGRPGNSRVPLPVANSYCTSTTMSAVVFGSTRSLSEVAISLPLHVSASVW